MSSESDSQVFDSIFQELYNRFMEGENGANAEYDLVLQTLLEEPQNIIDMLRKNEYRIFTVQKKAHVVDDFTIEMAKLLRTQ